jgi:hypothetical protein
MTHNIVRVSFATCVRRNILSLFEDLLAPFQKPFSALLTPKMGEKNGCLKCTQACSVIVSFSACILVFCASFFCRFDNCGSTLISFSAQRLSVICLNLLLVQCSVVHRPARSLPFIAMCFKHCGSTLNLPPNLLLVQRSVVLTLLDHCVSSPCSITTVPRWISRFFALLAHCVSSPCGSNIAVPHRISFSAVLVYVLLGLHQPGPTGYKWRFCPWQKGSPPARPYGVQMVLLSLTKGVSASPALRGTNGAFLRSARSLRFITM